MESLAGKNAIITGAGKGIGKAIAKALAAEGVNVGLIARSEKDLQEVASEVSKLGIKAFYATADVADKSQIEIAISILKNSVYWLRNSISNYNTLPTKTIV